MIIALATTVHVVTTVPATDVDADAAVNKDKREFMLPLCFKSMWNLQSSFLFR
jgi:hypothetical protein